MNDNLNEKIEKDANLNNNITINSINNDEKTNNNTIEIKNNKIKNNEI